METRRLVMGDVVQIDPAKDNTSMPGCFAQVEEVYAWGVQAWVQIPMGRAPKGVIHFRHDLVDDEQKHLAGRAYVRLAWEDMEFIGHAKWVGEP